MTRAGGGGNFNRRIHLFIHVPLSWQIVALFVIAIPIACVAWTITHEEVFREPRDYCIRQSETSRNPVRRKFFYLFTCEYCFSHYVTLLMLCLTDYKLLLDDWRGYVIAGFALVFVANVYMSLFALIRIDLKKIRIEANKEEAESNNVLKK
jgi:hypothetical protein